MKRDEGGRPPGLLPSFGFAVHHPRPRRGPPPDARGGKRVCVRRTASLRAVLWSLRKEGTLVTARRVWDGRNFRRWRRWIGQQRANGLSMRAFHVRKGLATAGSEKPGTTWHGSQCQGRVFVGR